MATPFDIRALARLLPIVAAAGLLGAVVAFAASYLVQPVYRASILLAPSEAESTLLGGSGGGLLGVQSVASLVGLSGQSDSVDKALAILRSRSFCETFLDPGRRKLIEEEWRARNRISAMRAGRSTPLSTGTLCAFLARSVLGLAVDPRTRFVTLSILLTDRQEAAQWANDLSAEVNEKMRQTAIENAAMTLQYLEKELASAAIGELRQAMARAMEAQVKIKAFAATRPSYVFSVVDPAVVPDDGQFEAPRRMRAAIGGGFLSAFVVLLVLLSRRRT